MVESPHLERSSTTFRSRCSFAVVACHADRGQSVCDAGSLQVLKSIHIDHLRLVMAHLGMPSCLTQLAQFFYHDAHRLFSSQGILEKKKRLVSHGLVQGCPLSPLLAAAVTFIWTRRVTGPGIECMTFVDDRSLWGVDPAAL